MVIAIGSIESRWRRALSLGLLLLVGSLVPSPFERHAAFERVGPDKALHCIGHAGFAIALAEALAADGRPRRRAAGLSVALSTALGALVGVCQRWVPGRMPERADLVAGILGSVVATTYWLIDRHGDGRSL